MRLRCRTIGAVEAGLGTLSGRVNNIGETQNALQDTVAQHRARIDAQDERIAETQEKVKRIESSLAAVKRDIAAMREAQRRMIDAFPSPLSKKRTNAE